MRANKSSPAVTRRLYQLLSSDRECLHLLSIWRERAKGEARHMRKERRQ